MSSLKKPILGWFQAGTAQNLNGATVAGLEHRDSLIELPDVKKLYKGEPHLAKMVITISGGVQTKSQYYLFITPASKILIKSSISRVLDTGALVQFDLSLPSPCRVNACQRSSHSPADSDHSADRRLQ